MRNDRILCNSNYLLKHVLINCIDIRKTFYNINTIFDLFTNVAGDTIFFFFLKISIYIQKLVK